MPKRSAAQKSISPELFCEPEQIGEQPEPVTSGAPWLEEWERAKVLEEPFPGGNPPLTEQSPQRTEAAAAPPPSDSEPVAKAEQERVAWYTVSEPEEPGDETLVLQTAMQAPSAAPPEPMVTTDTKCYETVEESTTMPAEAKWYTAPAQEAPTQQSGASGPEGGWHAAQETQKAEYESFIPGLEATAFWEEGTIEPQRDAQCALVEEMEAITVDDYEDDCPQWQEDGEDLPAAKEEPAAEEYPHDPSLEQTRTDFRTAQYQPPSAPIKRKLKDILRSLPGFSDL